MIYAQKIGRLCIWDILFPVALFFVFLAENWPLFDDSRLPLLKVCIL
jgi:hypothetical protein